MLLFFWMFFGGGRRGEGFQVRCLTIVFGEKKGLGGGFFSFGKGLWILCFTRGGVFSFLGFGGEGEGCVLPHSFIFFF